MSPPPPSPSGKNPRRKSAPNAPLPACPNCGMVKNDWPGEGYTQGGQNYCCQGCAENIGCTCRQAGAPGFSRAGQKATAPVPRPGKQRSGAPAPGGELSGERDARGTEEGIDEAGQASVFVSAADRAAREKGPSEEMLKKDATPPVFAKKSRGKSGK